MLTGTSPGVETVGTSFSDAWGNTSATGWSTSTGHRDVAAAMTQDITDRTHQASHMVRNRRASVVREVSQSESESISTRTLTNYTLCTPARKTAVDAAGVPTFSRCQGIADSGVVSDQPFVRDPNAMRNGNVQNISTSLQGGGDRYSFRVSFDKIHDEGILFNNNDDRRSIRTNFTFNPTTPLDFTMNTFHLFDSGNELNDATFTLAVLQQARNSTRLVQPGNHALGNPLYAPDTVVYTQLAADPALNPVGAPNSFQTNSPSILGPYANWQATIANGVALDAGDIE